MKGVLIAPLVLISAISHAQLIRNPAEELQEFCEYPSSRRTIVYLDQSIIAKSDGDWFRDIQNKISYIPSEEIHFVMISSADSRAQEIWSVCYPSMSDKDLAAAREEDSMFSRGIDKKIEDSKLTFSQLLTQALAFPLNGTTLSEKPSYSNDFPQKALLEALYYDSGRYSLDGSKVTRVILFSDMVENSNLTNPNALTSVSEAIASAKSASVRFPVDFNGAEFFVYGVGYSHSNSDLNSNLEIFWRNWFHQSGATLSGYSAQLTVPSITSLEPISYRGMMKQIDGSNVSARLRLGLTNDGKLENSWFSIQNARFPLKGDYVCVTGSDECQFNATVTFADDSANLFRRDDVLLLTGSLEQLSGTIGAVDDLTRTPDGKIFSMPVEFTKDARLSF